MGGKCPSSIVITKLIDDTSTPTYVKTHFRHNKELKHLALPKEDKLELASFISSRAPRQLVWKDSGHPGMKTIVEEFISLLIKI